MFGVEDGSQEELSKYGNEGTKPEVKKAADEDDYKFGQPRYDAEGKRIKNEEFGVGEEESSDD